MRVTRTGAVYAALGDSMSIDDHADGRGRGAASLLLRTRDHDFPAWAGTTVRVSVDSAGAQANGLSTDPAINRDGSVVAFFSAATNLVPDDANTCGFFSGPGQCPDIFAHVG